jgi:Growth inhibitor
MDREIKRGDIFLANLDPVIGSEQRGIRPCLILQNNIGNHYASTVIVAPITNRKKSNLPTHCNLDSVRGISCSSQVLLEQIRVIDKCRLVRHMASLCNDKMEEINRAIAISLDINLFEQTL